MGIFPAQGSRRASQTMLRGWPGRMGSFLRKHAAILLPALAFLFIVLAMNWKVFVAPMVEDGDLAANALQVQNAKHLHELLGNYSRWRFHHPGPFLFYVFAAGESVFYDWLHVVPAPLNGECLAEIIFSVACLFLSIHVFQTNIRKPLFPALAVGATALFLYAIDTGHPGSALTSLWLPYAEIFCFLLLAACAASVAAGNWNHVPLLALSGMIMIHGHAAQLLFATILMGLALLLASWRELRAGRLTQTLLFNKRHLIGGLIIVLLFLLPIALDAAIDHPSNAQAIGAYLIQYHGEHNSIHQVLLYAFSFLTYFPETEPILLLPSATLRNLFNPASFLPVYWTTFLLIALLALIIYFARRRPMPSFLKLAFAETGLITLMFLYWSWKLIGGMYSFEGHFFFVVQLFVLFALVAIISRGAGTRLNPVWQSVFACALTPALLLIPGIKNAYWADPQVVALNSSLNGLQAKTFTLSFEPHQWPTAAAAASYLKRTGKSYCVDKDWGFVFGAHHTCGDNDDGRYHVVFAGQAVSCAAPCSVLHDSPNMFVAGLPSPGLMTYQLGSDINFRRGGNSSWYEREGWGGEEEGGTWTVGPRSVLLLSVPETPDRDLALWFQGHAFVLPQRPSFEETVRVNNQEVARWKVSGPDIEKRVDVPRQLLASHLLRIEFLDADPKSPADVGVSADPRELGVMIDDLKVIP